MPKMKCAGGGDSKYELSSALLVHVIKLSAFRKHHGKLISGPETQTSINMFYFKFTVHNDCAAHVLETKIDSC